MNNSVVKNELTELLTKDKSYFTQIIAVAGRIGRWSIIDACVVYSPLHSDVYAFLEHNHYGDETAGLLVKLNLVTGEWDEIAESYDGLAQALYDEDIIDKMPDWD